MSFMIILILLFFGGWSISQSLIPYQLPEEKNFFSFFLGRNTVDLWDDGMDFTLIEFYLTLTIGHVELLTFKLLKVIRIAAIVDDFNKYIT